MLLADCTGRIEARVWDGAKDIDRLFDIGDVVTVEGSVSEYNGLQINIKNIKKYNGSVDLALFQQCTLKDRDKMAKILNELIESIKNTYLKKLLLLIFSDKDIYRSYINCPAAQRIHHAYIGGLLEHSLEVAEICEYIATLYEDILNRDLLITGALLHDIGKIREYDFSSISFEMTDIGKLVGHLVLGKEIIDEKICEITDFPKELQMEIGHMIISHHGEREWGSPEVPKTMEAFSLYHSDFLSAKLNQFSSLINEHKDTESNWTNWDKFLERSAFLSKYSDINPKENESA